MADLLLSFQCARRDTDAVVDALRTVVRAPIQIGERTVRGWDYDDATTVEQVSGLLRRALIELIVPADRLDDAVRAVGAAECAQPVRWHALPVAASGRIA